VALDERQIAKHGSAWEERYGLTPFSWEDPKDDDPIL
jgi:hypothetical protein